MLLITDDAAFQFNRVWEEPLVKLGLHVVVASLYFAPLDDIDDARAGDAVEPMRQSRIHQGEGKEKAANSGS